MLNRADLKIEILTDHEFAAKYVTPLSHALEFLLHNFETDLSLL